MAFIPVHCPACGSADVAQVPGGYRCHHCSSLFVRNQAPPVAPPPVQPPRQGVQSYGGAPPSVTTGPQYGASTGSSGSGRVASFVVFAVVAAISTIVYFVNQRSSKELMAEQAAKQQANAVSPPSTPKVTEQPRPTVVRGTPPSKPPPQVAAAADVAEEPEPIRAETYQPLKGCTCKTDLDGDGDKERVQLASKVRAVGSMITSAGTSRVIGYDFIVRSKGLDPIRLPLTKQTAPPSERRGNVLELGMACDKDHLFLAAGSNASSWSSRDAKWSWNAELPASYRPKNALPDRGNVMINCNKLPLSKDELAVRLVGGVVRLSTKNGEEPT